MKRCTPVLWRARFWALVACAALGLTGAANAQSHDSPNAGPFRTTSDSQDSNLMLEGHDAVAYFTQNEAIKGDPAIRTERLGVTYRFISEANKAEFLRAPHRYMPQFGGFCSNGINYAIPWGGGGGPEHLAHLPRQALRVRWPVVRAIISRWTPSATSNWRTSTGTRRSPIRPRSSRATNA